MRIEVNGEPRVVDGALDVAGLVALLGLEPRGVAVEVNRAIVPRTTWGGVALADGDRVEIVRFVGGG